MRRIGASYPQGHQLTTAHRNHHLPGKSRAKRKDTHEQGVPDITNMTSQSLRYSASFEDDGGRKSAFSAGVLNSIDHPGVKEAPLAAQ